MSSYEYHQLLQFLYFEGYANSYEEAEYIIEELTDEEFEELYEEKQRAHSFPLKPSELRSVENIRKILYGKEQPKEREKSAKRSETPQEPRRKRKTNLKDVIIAQYLYNEGYAADLQSAEIMSKSISEEWMNEIIEKFNPSDYKEYHQKNHRDDRNPSDEWDAQEKDWQDSRGDIRDKHNQARGVRKRRGSK